MKSRGVQLERHAISLDDPSTIENGTVKAAIELQEEDALPIIVLDGTIISIGGHPTCSEILVPQGIKPRRIRGSSMSCRPWRANMRAALAANDTTKFLLHCEQTLSLGLPSEELRSILNHQRLLAAKLFGKRRSRRWNSSWLSERRGGRRRRVAVAGHRSNQEANQSKDDPIPQSDSACSVRGDGASLQLPLCNGHHSRQVNGLRHRL